ncbi:MAG: nicotinate-nucleotide--dimethylbenzimidazole phosphoribosyltransferase, partial [Candidatus Baltobacteraceae bacterium]
MFQVPSIAPVDTHAARAARERIDQLTKPLHSLGRIEALAEQLAAISGEPMLSGTYERRAVLVGAGDHHLKGPPQDLAAFTRRVRG